MSAATMGKRASSSNQCVRHSRETKKRDNCRQKPISGEALTAETGICRYSGAKSEKFIDA